MQADDDYLTGKTDEVPGAPKQHLFASAEGGGDAVQTELAESYKVMEQKMDESIPKLFSETNPQRSGPQRT